MILHGTVPDQPYELLSKPSLSGSGWAVEQTLLGTLDQDGTTTTVWSQGRANLFFSARFAGDTDGDGLPDWYELAIGLDPNSVDTGNTGVLDGYKDWDNDGWMNFEELLRGTSPTAFNTPPPPRAVKARLDATANVIQTWESGGGPVSEYAVDRDDGWIQQEVGRVSAAVLAFTDNPDFQFFGTPYSGPSYRVRALFGGGLSSASEVVTVQQAGLTPDAKAVRGRDGRLYLAVAALPPEISRLWVSQEVYNWQTHEWEYPGFEIAASGLIQGIVELPSQQIAGFQLYVQGIAASGDFGCAKLSGFYVDEDSGGPSGWLPRQPFVDASPHLRENLRFLLRAATVSRAFGCEFRSAGMGTRQPPSSSYEYSGYRTYGDEVSGLFLHKYQPVEENWLWRNFLFHESDCSGLGLFQTGAGYDEDSGMRFLFYPKYELAEPLSYPPALPLTPTANSTWIYSRENDHQDEAEADIGLTVTTGGQLFLPSIASNLYGLRFNSVRTRTDFLTIVAGAAPSVNEEDVWQYFPEVEQPLLQTQDYYFAGWTRSRIHYEARPTMPGTPDFSPANAPPLLITAVGEPFSVAGWAKQRILNGDPNKYAYLEQYFDRAYQADEYGQATSTETGILSEYGEFFPTEPGPTALVTQPDPDQGSLRGSGLVHVIRLQLDVNHDGVMDLSFGGPDNTTAQRPFWFWVNDDYDDSFNPTSGTSTEQPATRDQRDIGAGPQRIGSARDLEDSARLWICGVPSLPAGEAYQVTLRWRGDAGPVIHLYRAFAPDGSAAYLSDPQAAQNQLSGSVGPNPIDQCGASFATIQPGTVYAFPEGFFSADQNRYFLFEAATAGAEELVLRIGRNGQIVTEASAFLNVHDVRDFYDQVVIQDATFEPTATADASSRPSRWQSVSRNLVPPEPETRQWIVFVHGWQVGQWKYENLSATMFKRLYWQGYRGRFAAVKWPTYSPQDYLVAGPVLSVFSYDESEYRAYRSAYGLADYLPALRVQHPDSTIGVCAHSMGNVVMAEALRILVGWREVPIDNYVLMQAAMPAHSYNPTLADYPRLSGANLQPAPDDYRGFTVGTRAAVRRGMVNFFNPEDYALATGQEGIWPIVFETNWEYWQQTQKPHFFGPRPGSHPSNSTPFDWYVWDGARVTREAGMLLVDAQGQVTVRVDTSRQVNDLRERLAYAARSRSKAAGALAGVGGDIAREVDLWLLPQNGGIAGFRRNRNEHSGQFNWNIQGVWRFYERLAAELLAN